MQFYTTKKGAAGFALFTCLAQAAQYVAAPNGNDGNPGSEAAPWRTVAQAIPRMVPGDTLLLRAGIYSENQIVVSASGVTIGNYPGEQAILDGGFAEFRTAGNSDWEPYDAAHGVYRSTRTYPAANAVFGYFGPENGSFRLATYYYYEDLSADNEDYAEAPHYFGPGVFWNSTDSRIYVRLTQDIAQKQLGYAIPTDPDPRDTPMILFSQSYLLRFENGAANLVIQGIALRYQNMALEFRSGAHDITISNCDITAGQYHIVVRDGAYNLTFDGLTDMDAFPPWVAWSDVKNWNRPAQRMQSAAFDIEGGYNLEIANSTLSGGFDAIDAIPGPHDVHIHDNHFLGNRDDVMEIGSSAWAFEVNDNVMMCGTACVSRTGSGAPPDGKAGTKYVHHNVMDASTPVFFGRSDPQNLLPAKFHGPAGDGMNTGRPFDAHTTDAVTGPDPWKIYHNTVFRRHYGKTMVDFIRQLRVDFAREQLQRTDMPLVDIALSTGFPSQAYFSTTFKRETGLTPGEYRRATGKRH